MKKSIKKPEIVAVTSATKPSIQQTESISFNVTYHNWKDRGKKLCSRISYQPSPGPEVSFDCPWTACCSFIATHMEEQQWIAV